MPAPKHLDIKNGDQLLLVGTMKGAFVLRSDSSRKEWDVGGPYFPGRAIYALNYDGREGRNRLWAAVNSSYWGSYLSTSNNFGKNWTEPETYGVRFPEAAENSVKQIWQIVPGNHDEPNTLYCGVEPAALFRSDDGGDTWSLVQGLYDHPHRPQWQPGGGGLCLHTILPDPANKDRMHIAISTGGVYRTDDGGKTWEVRNKGVRAQFMPEGQRYPEFGQCVHKIVSHPANPKRLFLQNHWDFIAATTAVIPGQISPTACRPTLVLLWKSITAIRTRHTSSHSNRMSFAARPKQSCECIARITPENRGSL